MNLVHFFIGTLGYIQVDLSVYEEHIKIIEISCKNCDFHKTTCSQCVYKYNSYVHADCTSHVECVAVLQLKEDR